VYFRDGHPDLSTGVGRRLIAHELAHAVGADASPTVHRFGGSKGGKGGGFFARVFGRKEKKADTPVDTEKAQREEVARLQQETEEQARLQQQAEEQARLDEARKKQAELDGRTKAYDAVGLLNFAEFEKYTVDTPEWAKHTSMTSERPDRLSLLAAFAQDPESGACPFTVGDLLKIGSSKSKMTTTIGTLRVYGQAVQNDPFPIAQATKVGDALAIGAGLKKLLAGFPRWVLASAMTEDAFEELRKANLLDDLIAYYQGGTMRPIFQAEDGADFEAYLAMRHDDNADPCTYQSSELKDYMRNFHRFEARLLDRLIVNVKDTSRSKPLTLVLHSNLDHNGAFHRDREMFRVVDSAVNNTLIVEGGETLGDYKSQITPLAQKYGQNNKIDQVMFAGHGNSQSMELAGGVKKDKEGKLAQTGDDLDVATGAPDKSKTDELFDEVLANMDELSNLKDPKQPNRRLLFNACLTNSNVVETSLAGDESNARKQIRQWIKDNMSLATYLNDRAKTKGVDAKALGANASINTVELINSKGSLDLVTSEDPKVTASKLEYAQEGREPTGVLRAAIEAYGTDGKATITAMKARMKATSSSSSFDDLIVWAAYAEFVDDRDSKSAAALNNLRRLAEIVEDFSHLQSEAHASLKPLRSWLKHGWGKRILDTVLQLSDAAKQPKQGLMLRIARLASGPTDATLQAAVMTQLNDPAAAWTVKSARVDASAGRYLDLQLLDEIGVLPALLTGPATHGKLVLALVGQVSKTPPAACTSYLQGLRKPAVVKVDELAYQPAVPDVPEQPAPRDLVPEVPAVPGRLKIDEIPGQRPAYPAVPELPKLEALPIVAAPENPDKSESPKQPDNAKQPESLKQPQSSKKSKSPKKSESPQQPDKPKPVVMAPGRKGRPERKAVDAAPAVEPYFEASLKIEDVLGGASTARHVLKSL
jgi:hypothetical protein